METEPLERLAASCDREGCTHPPEHGPYIVGMLPEADGSYAWIHEACLDDDPEPEP